MTTFFVDSCAWLALFDRADKYHAIASSEFRKLHTSRLKLITSDYILDETLTLLRYRCNHRIALDFGNWVQASNNVKIVQVDQQLWQAAWQMFQDYSDKAWAFTDCTSFILMQEFDLSTAFTFDRHFKQAGLICWPNH